MIKTIIVEDNKLCVEALKDIISSGFPDINIVAICTTVEEGREAILNLKPDLVFLDVELKNKKSFDMLKELPGVNFDIIFTTTHEKYAMQAIKASAIDFLLKPVQEKDVREALNKLSVKKNKEQIGDQVKVLFQHYARLNDPNTKIALPTQNGLVFVLVNDIIRCESDDVYTTFHMTNKARIMVSKSLKESEEMLAGFRFFRTHQSHLIHKRYLKEYIKGEGGIAKMTDDSAIPVARRKKEEFLAWLKEN